MNETKFADLNLRDFGLRLGWSEIDVVIINPESADKIFLEYDIRDADGDLIGQEEHELDVNGNYFDIPDSYQDESNPYENHVTSETWNFGRGMHRAQGSWAYIKCGEPVVGDDSGCDDDSFSGEGGFSLSDPDAFEEGDVLGTWYWTMINGYLSGSTAEVTGGAITLAALQMISLLATQMMTYSRGVRVQIHLTVPRVWIRLSMAVQMLG